ncbi:unnamed protein product [Schistosoma curassoni]|nr:unnamed protein product [Schistosoma curassoni]
MPFTKVQGEYWCFGAISSKFSIVASLKWVRFFPKSEDWVGFIWTDKWSFQNPKTLAKQVETNQKKPNDPYKLRTTHRVSDHVRAICLLKILTVWISVSIDQVLGNHQQIIKQLFPHPFIC